MKLSEDLKSLLDSSIVDGEISSKERKVLLKRAISEGHDQDEFELHIDGLLFSKKKDESSSSESFFNKVVYHRKAGFKEVELEKGVVEDLKESFLGEVTKEYQKVPVNELKIRMWHMFSFLFLIITLVLGIFLFLKIENVDDALTRYDFEKAREIAADLECKDRGNKLWNDIRCPKSIALLKIIINEANYMADNNEFEKAFSVIEEIDGLEFYNFLYNNGDFGKVQSLQKDELYLSIISKGLLQDQLSEKQIMVYLAKIKSKKVKDQIIELIM